MPTGHYIKNSLYCATDKLLIDDELVEFPKTGNLYIKGFILNVIPIKSTGDMHPTQQYYNGRILDDPKYKLALQNNSNKKLTITLKNGKQKIVDSGVFIEYKDVHEIKIYDGTPLGYFTAFGIIPCGEFIFNITQQDPITTKIIVSEMIGG